MTHASFKSIFVFSLVCFGILANANTLPNDMIGTACENYSEKDIEHQRIPDFSKGAWATTSDYPAKALRQGREGVVTFKVLIGTDGRAKSCAILKSSGHDDLDSAACTSMLKRGQFTAAMDAAGALMEGCWAQRQAYRLPK